MSRVGKENDLIVLFDGLCGLCSRLNRFILNRDVEGRFRFAPLQSEFAHGLLERHGRENATLDTVYVVCGYATPKERLLSKSEAVLQILSELGGYGLFVGVARFFPRTFMDFGYDLVAKNRFRFFERYEACPVPRPGERDRFIQVP